MSQPESLDADGLYHWAQRAVAEFARHRADINALNVFPVPDADTGSNMAHTMEAALAQADRGGDVAEALAVGSVRGARGNSGMVLSQVLRALADSTTDSRVDAAALADALSLAVELVDRAIADPVEGTIVTVLRAAAAAADAALAEGIALYPLLQRVLAAAQEALDATPSQLPALREAGVVDAGGAGLLVLLDALRAELDGAQLTEAAVPAESTGELEVIFYFEGDVDALTADIAPRGNSLVVARDGERAARVHIHTTEAGPLVELAFARGAVSNLRLEALPGVPEGASESVGRTVWAAAPAGPLAELFAGAGAEVVEPGRAVEANPGDIFLVNGSKGDAGEARVVPTDSYVAGIAALSVYDPTNADTDAVVSTMRDAARSMRVVRPAAVTFDALVVATRRLLAEGGEQVTILSARAVDATALTSKLGVEVMALTAPGIETEIGVE